MEFTDLKSQYRALKASIDARIQTVLDHGQYIMGPEVRELEEKLASFVGARHCITAASGTEALLMSLMALGVGRGDEVITSPFTFAATAEVIVLVGATPVFVDIEPDTCLIDASKIAQHVTSRTKAIMPVSLYGQVCDMDAIERIAALHGLPVIEDAAQSFGATYRGRRSCNTSLIGCTSFFPSKPLGCYGDGGAIFTSDDAVATACREIRVHGQSARYKHTRLGVGGRMDTLQCAIVLAKLERFDWELARRKDLGTRYCEAFRSPGSRVEPIVVRSDRDSVWGQFTVQLPNRESVASTLKAAGIPTAIHYPVPLHHQPAYAASCVSDGCSVSVEASKRVLSLPMSADLEVGQLESVVTACVRATQDVGRVAGASI